MCDFKHERTFGGVAKIPIANTPIELAEMDFADYVDFATFLHIRDTFPRFSVIVFMGAKTHKRRKWYDGMRFRIGRQRSVRPKSWRKTKIPDL